MTELEKFPPVVNEEPTEEQKKEYERKISELQAWVASDVKRHQAAGPITDVDDVTEFDLLVNGGDRLVIVFFHVCWSGACFKVKPEFGDLTKAAKSAVLIRVDAFSEEIAKKAGVDPGGEFPLFQAWKGGSKVDEKANASLEDMSAFVEKHDQ